MIKHTPVRYIDRLNTIRNRLDVVAYGVDPSDPEVGALLRHIGDRLGHVIHMINRSGDKREESHKKAMQP
jgi:hypothetical protein